MTIISSHVSMAALAAAAAVATVTAFAPPSIISTRVATTTGGETSSTSLNIIGPMIRKMREKDDKKNMPMASSEESRNEAPGLRVGDGAWKWPPVWPYDSNFFKREAEMNDKGNANPLANPMQAMMGGDDANGGENGTDVVFDSLKFWDEKKDVMTELDERVVEKITK